MKKVKIGFWLIVVAFLVLVGFQNKDFFLQKHSFDLNLGVTAPYHTPEIYNAVLFAGCFLAGLVIAYLLGLFERYKVGKTNKQIKKALDDRETELAQLKTENEALKNLSDEAMPAEEEDREETAASAGPPS